LGKGAVILVIASDLHEEAPVWYLRLKAAAKRGAKLIVAGARPTKLERYAAQVVRYAYGEELNVVRAFMNGAERSFHEAEQAVIFYGSEGFDLAGSQALARACADLLAACDKKGKINSGLVGVWSGPNTQGAWDQGFRPSADLAGEISAAGLVWAAGADPAGDDPALAKALDSAGFVVVQELFLTETARKADIVFPAQSMFEREGTYTSGERRVQRFYPVISPISGTRADYAITALAAAQAGVLIESRAPALVFLRLAAETPAYNDLNYQLLGATSEQWPIVGRNDLYFGGTGYENKLGMGEQLNPAAAASAAGLTAPLRLAATPGEGEILLVPVAQLYDQGRLMQPARLLDQRKAQARLAVHPETAARLGLAGGEPVEFLLEGQTVSLPVVIDGTVPAGVGLVPRSTGVSLTAPAVVRPVRAAVRAA
jgi:NADH-quinone oxidoreductase subunit G